MSTHSVDKAVLTRDGIRLSVREYGNPRAAHTAVFMHGLCLTKNSWNLQAERLIAEWGGNVRVISYDHRGHGSSSTAPMYTYNVPQLANDLADVLRVLKVGGDVTLSGHSMGGMTIMQYMAMSDKERPVDPSNLTLVATSAGNIVGDGIGALLNVAPVNYIKTFLNFTPAYMLDPWIRAYTAPIIGVAMKALGYTENYDEVMAAVCTEAVTRTPIHTKLGFAASLADFDVRGTLKDIRSDVSIFSGGRDFLTPPSHSDFMESAIPHVRREHFAHLGHMVLHEVPEAVSATLNKFVSKSFDLSAAAA